MSTEVDPAKLKVVELRAELSGRGLDTKGNKAVLVKRLKDALEKELQKELPDTSIADTSTEDFNSSQTEELLTEEEQKNEPSTTIPAEIEETRKQLEKIKDDAIDIIDNKTSSEEDEKKMEEKHEEIDEPAPKKAKTQESPEKLQIDETTENKKIEEAQETKTNIEVKVIEKEKTEEVQLSEKLSNDEDDQNMEENGVKTENVDEESLDKKSLVEESMEAISDDNKESDSLEKKEEIVTSDSQQRGDKRKRSPSPSRSQRRRSKSPIKEDEPAIDNGKVQLNWYDSDLHLQIDKESFLSGRPYHDGAFGYVWSGARATHGASCGKVCYEVKITEELKWEDVVKHSDRSRKDRERRDSRRDRSERRDKSPDRRKHGDKSSDKRDSKHKGKDDKKDSKTSSKGNGKAENKEKKPTEEESAKEEDKDDRPKAEKDVVEEEAKQEEVKEGETKTEEEGEMKDEDEKKEETKKEDEKKEEIEEEEENDDEDEKEKKGEEDTKMETDEVKDSQKKEEKSDEPMEVEEDKGDKKAEDSKEKKEGDDSKEYKKDKENSRESKEKDIPPIPTHLIRIGWSSLASGLQLGESKFSYGYESSGKFFTDKQFSDYGKPFAVGDVVGAYLEFSDEAINIRYTLNGEELPIAISIPVTDVPEEDFSLFPHILSRNYAFEVNLGGKEEPFFKNPESLSDYVYIDKVENKILGPIRPSTRSECEVIMMCGLPASGKTHWVQEHVANNPDKRYTVIGNTQLLEKMTVNGGPLKACLKGRWNVLFDKLSKCLNKLVEVAAMRRRNYVIDQTNVFPSAQRRKMRPFEGFKRRAVIVVCGDEEQARRRSLQEAQDGKDVSNIAVYEMKANMSLPKVGDWLEEVTYVELDEQEAKAMIQKYNKEGKDNGFAPYTQRRDYRDDRTRWHQSRSFTGSDYRGGYRDRSYPPSRFDRGSKHGWQGRSSGTWSRSDRRDSRGSSGRSRDWRNNNRGSSQRHQDRGRDRNRHSNRDTYSRSRNLVSSRNPGGAWQSSSGSGSGSWGSASSYSGSQGAWQSQSGSSNWSQSYGSSGQGKWSYGGQGGYSQQQGYGNYPNWNYYGQYQNWSAQNQPQQAGANSGSSSGGSNTGWTQYPQQYTHNPGNQSAAHK